MSCERLRKSYRAEGRGLCGNVCGRPRLGHPGRQGAGAHGFARLRDRARRTRRWRATRSNATGCAGSSASRTKTRDCRPALPSPLPSIRSRASSGPTTPPRRALTTSSGSCPVFGTVKNPKLDDAGGGDAGRDGRDRGRSAGRRRRRRASGTTSSSIAASSARRPTLGSSAIASRTPRIRDRRK